MPVSRTLLEDVTAEHLAMDSPPDGYPSNHVIGPAGSTVEIDSYDDGEDSVLARAFKNDPFAEGYIPRRILANPNENGR